MTSDTFVSRYIASVFAGGDPRRQKCIKTGEAGIYPGYAIRVSNSVMYLAKQSDNRVSGVCDLMDGHALDAVYSSGDLVEWFMKGQDTDVWVYLLHVSPAVAVNEGDPCIISATDGMVASGVDNTDLDYRLGNFVDYNAGSATLEKLVRINLSGG